MLVEVVCKIAIKRDFKNFIRVLSKIEFGVSIFCQKIANDARNQNHANLAEMLDKHSKEEYVHGKMLASLIDGKDRELVVDTTFQKASFLSSGMVTKTSSHPSRKDDVVLSWESVEHPGELTTMIFEQLDGISKKYFSAKLLFGGKSAYEFDWIDRLAFMCALERKTQQLYSVIEKEESPLGAIAKKIHNDEVGHSDYLLKALGHFTNLPNSAIEKWESRIFWAQAGLIIDLINYV